jgi:hypothetical protein
MSTYGSTGIYAGLLARLKREREDAASAAARSDARVDLEAEACLDELEVRDRAEAERPVLTPAAD